ncbi:MAG: peptidoglycan endopeptidase [Allosphingosinicella sp.]
MSRGERVAARARSLVGARFRPQGRDPETGLDCVGAAAAAAGVAAERIRRDYAMRGQTLAEIEHDLCDLGCVPVPGGAAAPGDVIVCATGPAQFHILVSTATGFVHADARLRMVVERPLPPPWPVVGVWRLAEGEE